MFEQGGYEEVQAALKKPLSLTAGRVMGLREVAELEPEQAIEALVLRTRRYAAYQRKWMRRIPGLVRVDANRSIEEVANEIVEVARTRERLPPPGAV
jgi:tRNA A37 N6-isopentenylltransferase MiaA